MKKQKISEKYTSKELAESFVFRSKLSEVAEQRSANYIAFAREKLRAKTGKDHSLRFKLLQLKFQMEDSITNVFDESFTFASFLSSYVKILNIKRFQFAEQISIDETYLSQLINRHRLPSEEVLIRLEIHSQNLINALTWYKIIEKEKENELHTDKAKRKREKKFVKTTVELN